MDIAKLSQLGEGSTLEYKRNTDSLDAILKCIIAFANTAGDVILIGVDDDGTLIGVDDPGKCQEKLANAISHRVKPELIVEISLITSENKSIIVLQIEQSPQPYYLSDKGIEKSAYIRIANSNKSSACNNGSPPLKVTPSILGCCLISSNNE